MMIRRFACACVAVLCALIPLAAGADVGQLRVVTTMSTLASLILSVGGDRVWVTNLVPVGASPEDYQPSPRDVEALHLAKVLIENGAGLEGWLDHTVESAKNPSMRILTCADGIPLRGGNPHLWMDPEYARIYVGKIRDVLITADPAGRSLYEQNARLFDRQLVALEHWIRGQIATVPPEQRNMIVFHDAWTYYDDRFGLRTIGVVERSPGQEPNPHAIADLVVLARRYHVHAVFAEPEYSPKLIEALAESAHISTVTDLYDDSLSVDSSIRNYIGMLQYDTTTIVSALR